jgi:excisionase family DNA binding protein
MTRDSARLAALADLLAEEVVERVLARIADQAPRQVEGFIGAAEAARRAGVEQATIRHWIKAGALPATKRPGVRGWKIKPADLESFLAGVESEGAKPVPDPVNLTARRIAASIGRKTGGTQE